MDGTGVNVNAGVRDSSVNNYKHKNEKRTSIKGLFVLIPFLFFFSGCFGDNAESVIQAGPYVRFTGAYSAEVIWDTSEDTDSIVEFGLTEKLGESAYLPEKTKERRVILNDLQWRGKHYYRVGYTSADGVKVFSETHKFDNSINYTRYDFSGAESPYPADKKSGLYSQAANEILKQSGIGKGYCLVYGCGEGRLAFEIAKRTDMMVIGISHDRAKVDSGRKRLIESGVYGCRVKLLYVDSMSETRLPGHFFNLIVSDSILSECKAFGTIEEVCTVLRPCGGKAVFMSAETGGSIRLARWLKGSPIDYGNFENNGKTFYIITKGALPSTGFWPRQYGGVDNASYCGGSLLGAAGTKDLKVQWLGRPGADFGADRNPRMPAPVMVHGRLYHQGLDRIAAMDSYNGLIYWSLEVPGLMRVNMPRDSGYVCADEDGIFVAVDDNCWRLDGDSGKRVGTFSVGDANMEWGYVGLYKGRLYGSAQFKGAHYKDYWGKESWYDAGSGEQTYKVCGRYMFAMDKSTGRLIWKDDRAESGVLINSTITIGGGRVYFVESRHPAVRVLKTGRIGLPQLWSDQFIVALDAKTGKKLWEKSIDTANGIVVFFMQYNQEKLFISSSDTQYHIYLFDARNGNSIWNRSHAWTGVDHSGHMQHPAIFDNKIFYEPVVYDIETSEVICRDMGRHEGCATYAGADGVLIYRGQGRKISMWDVDNNLVTGWEGLRPSCWLSTIPAGGMVLSPEGGGGCSCNGWINTSVGFIAR